MGRPLRELMDLKGRVALVTGGAGHIGSAISEALAELRCGVAVLDVNGEQAAATAKDLASRHGIASIALHTDLEDEAALVQCPTRIADALGRLDIVVNCAALVGTDNLAGWAVPFPSQRSDTWRRALAVNLTGPFLLVQAAAPLLEASGHGSVINVASVYGLVGPDWHLYEGSSLGNPAAYAASKGGLLQLTRWLATTLAPGIRVNAVTPGGVFRNTPEPFHTRYRERTPLRRMATEEDLIGAVAYLASDLSRYVTGQNIVVDGGWTAW